MQYSLQERTAIEMELISFALCKNENYLPEVRTAWINEFENMNVPVFEVVKRIRLAKQEKKFGNTEFATFMNVNLSDYQDFYEHEKIEIPEQVVTSYGYAEPRRNDFKYLKQDRYYILDEMSADKDSSYGYILIKDDTGYTSFYGKEHFKLYQG